jgi:carboxypeptidase PM20D1
MSIYSWSRPRRGSPPNDASRCEYTGCGFSSVFGMFPAKDMVPYQSTKEIEMKRFRILIKRAMVLLTAVLFVLAAIVLIRMLRLQSKQVQVSPITPVELDDGCVERLCKALQFRTISNADPDEIDPKPFLALHEFFEKAFPRTHKTLKREAVGQGGLSLLYTWEGTDPTARPFLLMSHIDVVPVETIDGKTLWIHRPFDGDVADGYIWGRGALDVKCGAVAILEAVEFLVAEGFQPECTIYIAMGHDEEVGGRNGNAKIATMLEQRLKQRDVRLRYVLDEGGAILHGIIEGPASPVAFVGVAEKGYAIVRLTASSPGGHPARAPRQTAIGILAAAIHKLEFHPMPTRIDGATEAMLDYLAPEMPFHQKAILANRWLFDGLIRSQLASQPPTNATIRTIWAVTMVDGGVAENVLPKEASACLNIRLLPGDTAESVLAYIDQIVNDDRVTCCLEPNAKEASPVSDTNSDDFRALHRTIREVFPDVIVAPGLTTGSTDSSHYRAITDNTFRFIPMRLTSDDLERIHGPNERIAVENYLEVIRFFIQQIRNSAS